MMKINQKRWMALLLCILLCAMAFTACSPEPEPEPEEDFGAGYGEAEDPEEDLPEPEEPEEAGMAAGFRLTDVVMEVTGARPVLWEEFYYDLQTVGAWLAQHAMMEEAEDWDVFFTGDPDPGDEPLTFNEYAIRFAVESALNRRALESLFLEADLTLPEEAFYELRDHYMMMWEADEERFLEILWEVHLTESAFRFLISEVSAMHVEMLNSFYQEGEGISEEDAMAFAEEQGIIRTTHILLMLDDNDPDEVREQSEAIHAELSALSGDAFLERFDELVQEVGEDPGMHQSPEGYTFLPGVMVSEFDEAARELDYGEMSEPVRSTFGYHIILRLPILPEAQVMSPGPGAEPLTLKQLAAQWLLANAIESRKEELRYTTTAIFDQLVAEEIFNAVQ